MLESIHEYFKIHLKILLNKDYRWTYFCGEEIAPNNRKENILIGMITRYTGVGEKDSVGLRMDWGQLLSHSIISGLGSFLGLGPLGFDLGWIGSCCIFRYHQLIYKKSNSINLQARCNFDRASCPIKRKSTIGFCLIIGNSLVSWKSKKQKAIS